MNIKNNTILLILLFNTINGYSVELSDKALFYRCYRQITQSHINPNNSLVKQVVNGQMDPIDACMSVFNKAKFTKNNNMEISLEDTETKNVVRTFHNLHFSWFTNKQMPSTFGDIDQTANTMNSDGPALFYTKALFDPNYQFKNIFLGNSSLASKRSDGIPEKGSFSGFKPTQLMNSTPEIPFLPIGDLVGVKNYGTTSYSATRKDGDKLTPITFTLGTHWGGGILGSAHYMLLNVQEAVRFKADGAVQMPRKWSQSVLLDFMCRELPVIRYDDALPYISNEEDSTPFRQEGACVRCHATIDRMSATIRNVNPQTIRAQDFDGSNRDYLTMSKWNSDLEGSDLWKTSGDSNFYRRPAKGQFYYRTYDGKKIDQSIANVENLGQVIGQLDDPYVCTAKRYYQYLTGIDANIDDIQDPQYERALNSFEMAQRNEVINIGKSFKEHQSLQKLIEEIMRKPIYKESALK